MKEQKIIHKQLIKNMLLNLILFSIIISLFSILIFTQLNRYLYVSVDQELRKCKSDYLKFSDFKGEDGELNFNIDRINNPRITCIIRNEEGELINTTSFGKNIKSYLKDIKFNNNNSDNIYEVSINSKYYYRGISFKVESITNESIYVELLVSVNSEKQMIDNFAKTLSIGTGIVILLSIFVSYGLAVKAMNPIVKNYRKQSEFIENVSHELRTPLTIIHAKLEMLLKSPNSKIIDKSEDIALTLNETRRLSKMIKELMDIARNDSKKITINKEKTDLNKLAQETITPYKEFAKVQSKNFEVNLNCKKEIKVDKNRIKQLLIILLDNALKYTEKNDTITVDISNKDDRCIIIVKDTGIGISDEGLQRAFERFYREDKARSRETGGTGLGLSIAYNIIKLHGGSIKMNHNKPKGTIVTIKI